MFVITIDQEGSTGDVDRVPELLETLAAAAPAPVLAFERTAGDEVQGLLADAAATLAVVRAALRLGRWQIGVGVGSVVTPLPASTRAASGEVFVRARDAVERAKSRRMAVPVAVTGGLAVVGAPHDAAPPHAPGSNVAGPSAAEPRAAERDTGPRLSAADAEALLQLLGTVVERRTEPGWEAVDTLLGVDAEIQGTPRGVGTAARRAGVERRSRSQAAGMLGVSEQALSKRLRTAAWQQERAVLPTLVRVLEEVDR